MAAMTFKRAYWVSFILLTLPVILGASTVSPSDPLERVRTFTRAIEFDFVSWTLNSFGIKLGELALGTSKYLPLEAQSTTVLAALDLIRQINQVEAQLNEIYADPNIGDPDTASVELRSQLIALRDQRTRLEPLAEAILQDQVNQVAAHAYLTWGGQAFPPVLFHTTPPPDHLPARCDQAGSRYLDLPGN